MNYTIRNAELSDYEAIYELFTRSVRPYVEPIWGWDETFQRRDFDENFARIREFEVIEVEGAFVGFLQTCIQGGTMELCEIHLRPQFRGRGIGSAVIRRLLADYDHAETGCFKANTGACALYQRLGFRLTGETPTHFLLEYHK